MSRTTSPRDRAARRGDARAALQTLELAWETAEAEGVELDERHVADAARTRPLRYDRAGDKHYDYASAFIKSLRGATRTRRCTTSP